MFLDNNGDLAGSNLQGTGNAFPPLNSSEIPNCTVVGKYPACSRDGESLHDASDAWWIPF